MLIIALVGCIRQVPKAVDCDLIVTPRLSSELFEMVTAKNAGIWIQSNFPTATNLTIAPPFFNWDVGKRHYDAYFSGPDSYIHHALLPEPTIADLLRCYGTPDFYSIRRIPPIESGGVLLQIWYVELRLEFSWVKFGWWGLPTEFNRDSPLSHVTIVPSNSSIMRAVTIRADPSGNDSLARIKPWPSNFVQVELEKSE